MQIYRDLHKYGNLTRGQENALAGALFLIGLIAAYTWGVSPHTAYLQASQQYERALDEHMDKSVSVNNALSIKHKKLQSLHDERIAFTQMAFSPAEANEFHCRLQTLCQEVGCAMVSLGYRKDADLISGSTRQMESTMILRSVNLTVHGPYSNIIELVKTLQSSPRKVWVDGFQMETLPSQSSWVECNMTITICVDHDKKD